MPAQKASRQSPIFPPQNTPTSSGLSPDVSLVKRATASLRTSPWSNALRPLSGRLPGQTRAAFLMAARCARLWPMGCCVRHREARSIPRLEGERQRPGVSAARGSGHPDRAPSRRKAACPPLWGVPFCLQKKGEIPPLFFSLKPLKTLKPLRRPFRPTATRASGRVGDSKDEYG